MQLQSTPNLRINRQLTSQEKKDLTHFLGVALLRLRDQALAEIRAGKSDPRIAYEFADAFHNLPLLLAEDRPVNVDCLIEGLENFDRVGGEGSFYASRVASILGIRLPPDVPDRSSGV